MPTAEIYGKSPCAHALESCPVPPLELASCPVHPAVIDVAARSAVVGVPPKVSVTLVSSVLVSAAPVTEITPVAVNGVGVTTIGAVAVIEVTVPLPPEALIVVPVMLKPVPSVSSE